MPGVNAALKAGGLVKDLSFLDDEYRKRGKAVHAATLHYDLTGERAALPKRWRGYLTAYVRLREAVPCRWRRMEQPVVSRLLRYAATPDRVGEVNRRPAVVEIKTGCEAAWHGAQLAGQDLLLPRGGVGSPRRRLGFYLQADGTFWLREYVDVTDYMDFLDAVEAWWGAEHGEASDEDDWL